MSAKMQIALRGFEKLRTDHFLRVIQPCFCTFIKSSLLQISNNCGWEVDCNDEVEGAAAG
jgi:hypothetical protein